MLGFRRLPPSRAASDWSVTPGGRSTVITAHLRLCGLTDLADGVIVGVVGWFECECARAAPFTGIHPGILVAPGFRGLTLIVVAESSFCCGDRIEAAHGSFDTFAYFLGQPRADNHVCSWNTVGGPESRGVSLVYDSAFWEELFNEGLGGKGRMTVSGEHLCHSDVMRACEDGVDVVIGIDARFNKTRSRRQIARGGGRVREADISSDQFLQVARIAVWPDYANRRDCA